MPGKNSGKFEAIAKNTSLKMLGKNSLKYKAAVKKILDVFKISEILFKMS